MRLDISSFVCEMSYGYNVQDQMNGRSKHCADANLRTYWLVYGAALAVFPIIG